MLATEEYLEDTPRQKPGNGQEPVLRREESAGSYAGAYRTITGGPWDNYIGDGNYGDSSRVVNGSTTSIANAIIGTRAERKDPVRDITPIQEETAEKYSEEAGLPMKPT